MAGCGMAFCGGMDTGLERKEEWRIDYGFYINKTYQLRMDSRKGHEEWCCVVTSKEFMYEEVISFQNMLEAREWSQSEEVGMMKELMPDLYIVTMSQRMYLQRWNNGMEVWWRGKSMELRREYGIVLREGI